jgi:dipeptidyl aminopeptidase/acylaminoacyl peptidase
MTARGRVRGASIAAAIGVTPFALAWRFAHAYRTRAGYPRRHPPTRDPRELGLPFEDLTVPSGDLDLPAWWIPARNGARGPAVLLVHGWESARDRTLPHALFLHAAGFHVLTLDVRGHGANGPEALPMTAGEFGADALAGVHALLARPDVAAVGVLGHSLGAIGALLAAAAEPRVAAVVATATPADPYRLTRQTFRLARLPLPDPIAYPLAWLTTRVFLEPRGHGPDGVSATRAIARYEGPILLVHGTDDRVVPTSHLVRLAAAARAARGGRADRAPIETLVIEGGQHSWLYEYETYRATVARFLAVTLGGPLGPDEAAAVAASVRATRLPDGEAQFAALEGEPGGVRTLVRAVGSRGVSAPRGVSSAAGASAGDALEG